MMRASLYQCFEEPSFPTRSTTSDDAALHRTQKAASSSLLFCTKQTMGTASASTVVRSAASLFQHHSDIDVEQILQALQREQLTEGWQLGYLDSFQWKVLGVPLGLVMCIRKCLFEDEPRSQREWEEMQSPVWKKPTKVNRACPSPLSVTQPPPDGRSQTPTSCHGSFLAEKADSSMDCQPPKMPQRKQSILQPGESQIGFCQRMFLLSLENDEDTVDRMGFLLSPGNTLHSRPPVQPKRLSSVSLASSMRSLFDLEGENCNRWRETPSSALQYLSMNGSSSRHGSLSSKDRLRQPWLFANRHVPGVLLILQINILFGSLMFSFFHSLIRSKGT